jgi:glucoamylase
MVLAAAGYLIRNGPSTPTERWEEISGYSPSTLAVVISALICAASFARDKRDLATATYLEEWADFLESNIEVWTFTHQGELLPGVSSHYLRARATSEDGALLDLVTLTNQPPGMVPHHLATRLVDGGFLDLVRYGIRSPNDPRIEASLRVVDHVLKVETPFGPVWRRFNHDGYGQQDNGDPFVSYGRGRAWPLLTAERALYESACGRDVSSYLTTLEQLANRAKLLPQQVWDAADIPKKHLRLGYSTGAAMPFLWAHAEYLTLLRSAFDKTPYSLIPLVQSRYSSRRDSTITLWKWSHQPERVRAGTTLQAETSFVLHYSLNSWQSKQEVVSSQSVLGVSWVDLLITETSEFTFFWPQSEHWEGKNFRVVVV